MNEIKPIAIRLSDEEIAALLQIAQEMGSIAKTGQYAGEPSWRTLLKDIANGRLVVTKNPA